MSCVCAMQAAEPDEADSEVPPQATASEAQGKALGSVVSEPSRCLPSAFET